MYPGLVYYLTFWYRPEERSLRIASFLANASLAGAFGGSIAYGVGHMNGVAGLTGWQWLFILEGIPSCVFAIVILTFLPDWPEGAKFLSADEKALAANRMRSCGSKGSDKAITWADTKYTLMDWRLYAHYLVSILQFFRVYMERYIELLTVHQQVVLPRLDAILQPQPVHPGHRRRSRIHISHSATHDHTSICRRIRHDLISLLVLRSFQLVSTPSFVQHRPATNSHPL